MILNGLLHIPMRQNGKKILKLLTITLIITLTMSGCSPEWWLGDGRGDWTIEIYEGYGIDKINSYDYKFIKINQNLSGGEVLLPDFLVVSYQLHEPFICLKGLPTGGMDSVIKEIDKADVEYYLDYYLFEAASEQLIGPIDSLDDFEDTCESYEIILNDEWIRVYKTAV